MRPTGNIRPRSDGSFEICYSLGTDPLTGKRKRAYATFKGSRQEAERELRRILRTIDTGEYVEPTKIKVSEFLTQWLETIRSKLSPKTHERYTQIVNHYLIPRFKAPKTERTRAVLLPDYAVEELRQRKEKQAKELTELEKPQTQETLVCARYDGEAIWPSSVTHEFIKAIRKLPNLPKVRFHDLRHSHATQLLAAGIHPKIAQERLGHSTISTTLDLYSHVTDTMQNEAAAKLDTAFRAAMKPKPPGGPQLG